jgi:protein-disulfide isomerase
MKIKVKYIAILVVIAIVVLGYYFYYSNNSINPSQNETTKFEQYAQDLGLNVTQFKSCMDDRKYKDAIQNDISDGQSYGVEGTPTFFINGKILVGALPLSEFQTTIDVQIANATQNQIRTGTNPPRGSANASAVIVMFSDYECPYCKAAEPTVKQILQQNSGKVSVYFRDYPLPIHPFAEKAAEASRCAGEQGKYWEYHDLLFEKQSEWTS